MSVRAEVWVRERETGFMRACRVELAMVGARGAVRRDWCVMRGRARRERRVFEDDQRGEDGACCR